MRTSIRLQMALVLSLLSGLAAAQTATNVVCSLCVQTNDIAYHAINSSKIADGTIKSADLADGNVTSGKIKDGTVGQSDLSSDVKARLGGMPVYAAGTWIGSLFDAPDAEQQDPTAATAELISDKGYWFSVNPLTGFLGVSRGNSTHFSGSGCTGEVYLGFPELGGYPHLLQEQGMVFRVFSSAMYLPRGSTGTDHAYLSKAYRQTPTTTCALSTQVLSLAQSLCSNDPAVTGVPGASFGTPVLFGVP